jgi:hypothetical protein
VLFKIDFEKAYGKVSWRLPFDYLHMRGFNATWCEWIRQVVSGGIVSIKLNDSYGPYIKSFKGVKAGRPVIPNIVQFRCWLSYKNGVKGSG